MKNLNYKHLFYFWSVAKEGGISRACEKLHLAQPTISGQLSVFEEAVGDKLFYRQGRNMILTDTGRAIFHYAEEIFTLGQELTNTLSGRTSRQNPRLSIGMADALPKLIAYRLIEPALQLPDPVKIVCYEDKADRLFTEISMHSLDLVLSDIPATRSTGIRIVNHLLGECGVAVFGIAKLANRYRPKFPASLNGAPLLVPTASTALRRSLDKWFDAEGVHPAIRAEIEDSALLKTFASAGVGLFVAPLAIEPEIHRQYGVETVGRITQIRERFYAVFAQRKLKHPGVAAILESAQTELFDDAETRELSNPISKTEIC